MGRRAKSASLLLLALGVAGAAAIHRTTHGIWFARRAAPAVWPARVDTGVGGWVSWNPIPIGTPIRGVWGERPDNVWAWSSNAVMRWDGRTWTRVPGPSLAFNGAAGWIESVRESAGRVWARTTIGHHDHPGHRCGGGRPPTVHRDWCRVGDGWELGECGPRTIGSRAPEPPPPGAGIREVESRELERLGRGQSPPIKVGSAYSVGGGEVWAVDSTGRWLAHFDGRTWTAAANPELASASGIWLAAADDGWAVGGNLIYQWDGSYWSAAASAPERLRSIWGAAADDVWAVGEGGLVMHFDGRAWMGEQRLPGQPRLASVAGRARDDVWIAGCDTQGFAAHWDGRRWTRRSVDPSGALAFHGDDGCLRLAPDRGGRAVAAYGVQTFAFADGGWLDTNGPLADAGGEPIAQGALAALAAGGGSEMWAVGVEYNQWAIPATSPLVLRRRYDVWRKVKVPVVRGEARAVWAPGVDDVWVVGNGGLILHLDGGVWRREESGTDEDLVAVHGAGGTIWIGGAEGGLLRRRLER